MTKKIYLEDQYRKELVASVVRSSSNELVLDSTIFYPTGGGQPCDTGTISVGGKAYGVIDVKKSGDEVVHTLSSPPGAQAGAEAVCRIDWGRRYSNMRYHTALHIIDGVITKEHSNGTITGGIIYGDRAHMDLDLPTLNKEVAAKIIEGSQAVVNEGRRVYAKVLTEEEALAMPDLARSEPGRELLKRLSAVRIIEIEGFDRQLDGGTHVANTSEVGTIAMSKFENKGSHRKRIEIKLL